MRLLASDVDGGAFAAAAGMTRLAPIGRGTVSVILKGDGSSWNSLLSDANGSFSASFGQGALSGHRHRRAACPLEGRAAFALDEVVKDASPIDALELKANIADGVATIEKAEVRSPQHRIVLSGSAPLGAGGLALSGKAEPPQQAAARSGRSGSTDDLPGRRPLERAGHHADDGTGAGVGVFGLGSVRHDCSYPRWAACSSRWRWTSRRLLTIEAAMTPTATTAIRSVQAALISGVTPSRTWL